MKRAILVSVSLCLVCAATVVAAQQDPVRPVTIVVPFPAGGVPDSVIRAAADFFTQKTGQRFIVDHKPGATQMIGMRTVAQARPDGYTLLFGTGTGLTINPHLEGCAVRYAERLCADLSHLFGAVIPRYQARFAGQFGRGPRRAGKARARQAQLCVGRGRGIRRASRPNF